MTSSQLAQSRLAISIATGEPSVSPARTPDEPLDAVALDLHARAAAVALHPAREIAVHRLGRDGQSGGQALDDGDEGLAVGFTGGGEAQVHGPRAAKSGTARTTERRKDNHSAVPPYPPFRLAAARAVLHYS